MSLVSGEKSNFQFILRLLNTNVREPLLDRIPRGEYGMRWEEIYTETEDDAWREGGTKNMELYANACTTG
jgi:hypothetical protein